MSLGCHPPCFALLLSIIFIEFCSNVQVLLWTLTRYVDYIRFCHRQHLKARFPMTRLNYTDTLLTFHLFYSLFKVVENIMINCTSHLYRTWTVNGKWALMRVTGLSNCNRRHFEGTFFLSRSSFYCILICQVHKVQMILSQPTLSGDS